MKKLLIISKSNNNKISSFLGAIFPKEYAECRSGTEAEEILLRHKADFVFLNDIKPVNGMDIMSVLRHIDGNIRLRVEIFYLGIFRKKENRFLSPVNSR